MKKSQKIIICCLSACFAVSMLAGCKEEPKPSLTEELFACATGAVGHWGIPYETKTGMTSFVTYDGKECIKLDIMPGEYQEQSGFNNRVLIIDLEKYFGEDLEKVETISFNYHLGTGFSASGSMVNFYGWWENVENYEYAKDNLFLLGGVSADGGCYWKENWMWHDAELEPVKVGVSKYIFLMIPTDPNTWLNKYYAGEKALDFSMYLTDFAVTYIEE